MKRLLLVIGIAPLLFSCNANRGWNAKDRSDFINSCINEASTMNKDQAKAYCECMQPKVESKYKTMAEVKKVQSSEFQSPEWITEVKKCLGMDADAIDNVNIGGNPVDVNKETEITGGDGDGWTGADRDRFVEDCYSAAKTGMGEEKARSYCECMQPKIEAKYRTLAAANMMTDADLSTEEWKKEVRACLGMNN